MMIPSQRWAPPSDTERDTHSSRYELWVNDLFERDEMHELGFVGDFDEALDSDWLFDIYMDEYNRSREP
jgi:hypothetical protein